MKYYRNKLHTRRIQLRFCCRLVYKYQEEENYRSISV